MTNSPQEAPAPPPNLNWIRYRSIAYLTGKGLLFGEAGILPPASRDFGKYGVACDVVRHSDVPVCDSSFSLFADRSARFVFVGRRLEEMPSPSETLRELAGKVEIGGHLILHVVLDRPWEAGFTGTYFSQAGLLEMVGKSGAWVQKDLYLRDGQFLGVFKRTEGRKGITTRPKGTRPRACIARYGALGDMVMLTPLIRRLHEDGFEVTLNITPYASTVLEGNPFISNIVHQERDAIPNQELGQYWAEWAGEYDKYINLSESIEGKLLLVEGRKEFYTSKAFRGSVCNTNYIDNTMAIGGYPEAKGLNGELFFTQAERRGMEKWFRQFAGKFVVLWGLKGSSHHKMYPMMEPVMGDWLERNPDAVLVTTGAGESVGLDFHEPHPQVVSMVGKWSIRESFLATQFAGVVVGPESALVNGASCCGVPKITLLSHSSHEMLCKHWENDLCLAPSEALAPCYPCRQLHYSLESCPLVELRNDSNEVIATGPSCAMGAITGEVLSSRLDEARTCSR
jgi:ADP-heptose:LPS heptosyltransferase